MSDMETTSVLSIEDYLYGKVKFRVPAGAMASILADRKLSGEEAYAGCDVTSVRLAYADLLKWFLLGHSKQNNVSDTDNGWSHSGGGYELDSEDRKLLKAEANAIYDELEPSSAIKGRATFRMSSFGVQRANLDAAGNPLPHTI